jgi:hypothetical protein
MCAVNKRAQGMLILLGCIAFSAAAQVGGEHSFDFVHVPSTARLSALGGVNVSLADRDVGFFAGNPALAGDTLSGMAAVHYQFYAGDAGQAFFAYAHDFGKAGMVMFGIQHMQYGALQGYDLNGTETGEFNSGETALMIGKSHQQGNFRIGVNIKGVFSNIAGYRAGALMVDLGGVFIHPDKPLTAGLVIRNAGFVLSEYTSRTNSSIPFDVQAGVTLKPEHMPLRFSVTAFNLTQADVTYYDPDSNDEKPGMLQKVLSHLSLGTEILIHKNATLLAGYNYFVRQGLKLPEGGGGAGISLGAAVHIKSFEFTFSRSGYVAGNAGYSFTLSANVNKILKRR